MNGSILFSSFILILILFILFFILSSTSDIFLSTAITKIVETFDINQNIAAVTLLAFGNGAPDVISSLVASSEVEGLSFSISSLLGTGMFITSFVLGAVVYKGKDITVNSSMFNRDLILYLISLFHIILIGIKKKITIIDSSVFILIYTLNILCAFYQGRKNANNDNPSLNIISEENKLIIDEILNEGDINIEKQANPAFKLGKEIETIKNRNSANDFYKEYMNVPVEQKQSLMNEKIIGELKEDILKEQKLYINKKSYSETLNENMMMAKINFKKKYLYYKETEWREISFLWKIFYIFIDLPLTFIRELTIPLVDSKNWNKNKFCLFPLSAFIFISYVFNCK
jgi:sodium/potassium/calcium exchanger 6